MNLPSTDENKDNKEEKQLDSRRLGRKLLRILLIVFVSINALFLLFQIPAIQTWTVGQITRGLSQKLGTQVEIGYFRLSIINKFRLKDVYVEDLKGDTLLFSKGVDARINLSPFVLLRKGLIVDQVHIEDSQLFIQRDSNSFDTNLQLLLARLKRKERKEKRNRQLINIELSHLSSGRLKMKKNDALKNQLLEMSIAGADIQVKSIDLLQNQFELSRVEILGPDVGIDDYERGALWQEFLNQPIAEKDSSDLVFTAESILVLDGDFALHNYRKAPVKLTPDSILDYKHMAAYDIKMDFTDFQYQRDTFSARVNCFNFADSSGFYLNDWSADYAMVSSTAVSLYGMNLTTPRTVLRDTLELRYEKYEDFIEFPEEVEIIAKLEDSRIAMEDIITFAPGLNGNPFFERNRNQIVRIDGLIRGEVNNLDGRNLQLALEDGSRIDCRFNSANLTRPQDMYIDINIRQMRANIPTLRRWLPNFDVPDNFETLGRLGFQGRITVLLDNLITEGSLETALGKADLNIQIIDMPKGKDLTRYNGKINLDQFDLGTFIGNQDYGLISLNSRVDNGMGLTKASAFADFSADISSFTYKGYLYENAEIRGRMDANRFNGLFNIKDDNIDFGFQGEIDLSGETPVFDFQADVNKVDLYALNISKKPLTLGGQVKLNLRNETLDELEGTVNLEDVTIIKDRQAAQIEYFDLTAENFEFGTKAIRLRSDLLDAQINGVFSVDKIPGYFARYLEEEFPLFSHQLQITSADTTDVPHEFRYKIEIKDTKGLQTLFVEQLSDIQDALIEGEFSNLDSIVTARIRIPDFRLGNLHARDLGAFLELEGDEGDLNLQSAGFSPAKNIQDAPITLLSTFNQDTVYFGLTYDDPTARNMLNRLYFDGRLVALDSTSTLMEMEDSRLEFWEDPWLINNGNSILFKQDSIIIKDFVALQDDRTAALESFSKRGIALNMVNLDFDGLNPQLRYEPLQFDGDFNLAARTADILALTDIHFEVDADSLLINGDDWGSLDLIGQMDDAKQPVVAFASLTKDTTQLLLDAFYNVADVGPRAEEQKGFFDANLSIQSFPMWFAEYFIGGTISDATGGFNAKLRISGQTEDPNIYGAIQLKPGAITLNYLKTRYSFGAEEILVDNYFFDASGTELYDVYGNVAYMEGGIRHNHLKNFGFDARLTTERFQGLNTQKGDNKLFYGLGIGSADVQFLGSFAQPDIYVNATTAPGTTISIPISSEKQASEFGFIQFVDKSKEARRRNSADSSSYDLKGVSLDMDLNVNNAALLRIIFDEQTGDIIEGRGRGALQISVPRDGDFKMYGDYTINSGDYLFTLYNLINKKFSIRRGGTISWTGDPYTAEVDLIAEYNKVNTSVANFIQEYLLDASADLQNQASEVTDVNLRMNLTGDLLKPNINFDIDFPSLKGQLQTYTDSKLRLLELDQNELNKQVFGLIVAGQFLPADFNLQGTEIIYNTVGEFLSNQLSLLLTELLSEVIGEGKVLSGIDFGLAYSQYQNANINDGQNINRGNELEVSITQNFFNDRFSVKIGGNVDLDGRTQASAGMNNAFVGNDLIFEAIINEERTVTMRVYQKSAPDIGGRKLEIGAGVSYRKEFDSFGEFLRSFKQEQ
ncbi:MAG TPA: translocation/assembly module TamB domain-containing protein [Saprospiraceae bacterium]|nr:translocation/assembly module TamB domain-containing protein [Saprospiraceae bacterium]